MPVKYSRIKSKVQLEQSKRFQEGAAALTHYWQSGNNEYRQHAVDFLAIAAEPDFHYELPFDYDVPFPPVKEPEFTFIDLFAGIGGFRIAMQEQNGKCVFSSEWDRWAQKTYEANFGEVPFGDITKIDAAQIPDHDVLVGGFPCQPFSLAGVSKKNSLGRSHGFEDETQGTLFFDIKRIIKSKKPKAFLLENVKNLKSHDKGRTYEIIRKTLKKLGYHVFDQILDARHYVPQHRERIFIVGFSKEHFKEKLNFEFAQPPDIEQQVGEILLSKVDEKYTLSDKLWQYLKDYAAKHQAAGNGFGYGLAEKYKVTRTLSARYHKDGSEILIPQRGKNPRRLTPEECRRLMGFPDNYKIKDIGVSDTQLYRQFGNSVAVPVVRAVVKEMMKFVQNYEQRAEMKKKGDSRKAAIKSHQGQQSHSARTKQEDALKSS